jgi:hypothetical protein
MLLELVPRGPPESVPVSRDAGNKIQGVHAAGPVLLFPRTDALLQLYSLDAGMDLVEGQSGVVPANAALLRRRIDAGGPDHPTLEEVLRFARPAVVASRDPQWIAFLSGSPLVAARGCRDLHGIALCFFEPSPIPPEPLLRLDRDGVWDLREAQDGHPIAALVAKRGGVLDYAALGRCTTREQVKLPGLPAFARRTYLRGLETPLLQPGAAMLVREWRQSIFRLPAPLRPTMRISVLCAG